MTPEEKIKHDELIATIEAKQKLASEAAVKAFKESPEFSNLVKEAAKAETGEQLTAVKAKFDELSVSVDSRLEQAKSSGAKGKTLKAQLEAQKTKFDALKSDRKAFSMELEAKATQTSTNIDGRDNYFEWHEGGRIGHIPVRQVFMRNLFRNATTGREYVKYIDQETVVRDAKNVALCGATTSNTTQTWKVYDLKVDKVRDFTTLCIDMLDDYEFVESETRLLLNQSLELKIDNDLLLGDGISPNLYSVDYYASTFSATNANPEADYTASVAFANIIDLFSIAGAQIRTFGANNAFKPNVIVMNPRDMQLMKLLKDDMKNYIKTPMLRTSLFQDVNGYYYIDGMLLVENSLVPANEAYIFDSTKGTVYARPNKGLEFAYENRENFEMELVTVKGYERLNLLVRNVDGNAFMHIADIAQAIFDISQPT